ncbi:unnamed protein product [Fusarium langsethiae]|nr:unnamed protein product [Fusarium langsethiae]
MSLEIISSAETGLNVVLENPAEPIKKRKRLTRPTQPTYTVPLTEEQWRKSRLAFGLATSQSILDKITGLEDWDKRELQNWEKILVIAATVVDLDRGQEDATLKLGKAYPGRMSYESYRKDRAAVLNLIKLLDRLYASLEHRAFELLVMWDMPLSSIRLWSSTAFNKLLSGLPEILLKPSEEIQASLTLYIPFLVQILRPQYSLDIIQKALKTRTLTQCDLDLFQKAYRTRQCVPSLLSTLGDSRTPHCDLEAATSQPSQEPLVSSEDYSDLADALHLDRMFPAIATIHIEGYTTFDISHELQRKASQASKEQGVCNIIKRQDTSISQYNWSDIFHLPVADQAIDDLVRIFLIMKT